MIEALSFTSRTVEVGGAWVLRVAVTDSPGVPSTDAPELTITAPTGGDVTVTMDTTTCPGVYASTFFVAFEGRHTAVAAHAEHGQASFVAQAQAVTDNDNMPSVASCNEYIGDHSWTDAEVQRCLDQERAAQFATCRVPAAYPPDLRGALHRRVQRSLAMRHLALAVKESVDGETQMVVPGRDPEVRRLEAPYRRVTVG